MITYAVAAYAFSRAGGIAAIAVDQIFLFFAFHIVPSLFYPKYRNLWKSEASTIKKAV
jgi:hypothetical protein